LNELLGQGQTFWLFSGLSMLGTVFVFFIVPETKGKSLNEIQKMLSGDKNASESNEEQKN
jgi:Sugar (and other) transporter